MFHCLIHVSVASYFSLDICKAPNGNSVDSRAWPS